MAACVPVFDHSVGYKRKLSSVNQDTPKYFKNKVQRVEHEEFYSMFEVTNTEDQQELVIDPTSLTDAASYPELNDIQFLEDHNQLHLADKFLMNFSSFDETNPNQDISAAPLPSLDEDNVINASATDPVQPQSLTDSTADVNNVIELDDDDDDDDDNDDDDEVCIVINLGDDDDETASVLQESFTSVQTIQSTKKVKESSLKGNNDVQPSPTMTEASFLDSSFDCQMQHADNARERLYDDSHDTHDSRTVNFKDFYEDEFNHTQGISEDLDFTNLMDFEKLDLDFYENELDLTRLDCDALESPRTDSLVDASFPCLKQPTFAVREINGIEVVIID